jgi:Transcriptional regulator
MARNKDSNDTKNEIIEVATNLFIQNGYEKTTIEDIFRNWGGSKGSLYYYFSSKEDILDAVADALAEKEEKAIRDAVFATKLPALDMFNLFLTRCLSRPKQMYDIEEYIHQSKNVTLIYRITKLYIEKTIPILEPIIKQGIEEGVFKTDYPSETIEFALLLEELALKYPMFECDDQHYMRKIRAFQSMLESALGLQRGILDGLSEFCEQTVRIKRGGN